MSTGKSFSTQTPTTIVATVDMVNIGPGFAAADSYTPIVGDEVWLDSDGKINKYDPVADPTKIPVGIVTELPQGAGTPYDKYQLHFYGWLVQKVVLDATIATGSLVKHDGTNETPTGMANAIARVTAALDGSGQFILLSGGVDGDVRSALRLVNEPEKQLSEATVVVAVGDATKTIQTGNKRYIDIDASARTTAWACNLVGGIEGATYTVRVKQAATAVAITFTDVGALTGTNGATDIYLFRVVAGAYVNVTAL